MKEDGKSAHADWDSFNKEVDLAGGMEEYYKKDQKETMEHLQREVENPSCHADKNTLELFKKSNQQKIENIKALFMVYELLEKAGVEVSFRGLTHTMHRYAASVIWPMKDLLEQGKVEEALQLYYQPRRYWR